MIHVTITHVARFVAMIRAVSAPTISESVETSHPQPATKLAAWREAEGITLQEQSDLTGLSVSTLSRLERGMRKVRPATKVRIARRLGVPIRELFEVEELDEDEVVGE